jgi:hypothetical protein
LFLNTLDDIIKTLHKDALKHVTSGYITDYLVDSDSNRQLDAMLLPYNLSATVHFLTRYQGNFTTAIDNIFLDTYKFIYYNASPPRNVLSDHDAQLLIINHVNLQLLNHHIYIIIDIHNNSIEECKTRLSYESWDSIFGYNGNTDVHIV